MGLPTFFGRNSSMSYIIGVLCTYIYCMVGFVYVTGSINTKETAYTKTLPLRHKIPPVLYTIPGSGNTFIRQLIDHAVQGYSGCVYDDPTLQKGGLLGEFHCNTTQTVIKAHPNILYNYDDLFTNENVVPKCAKGGISKFESVIIVERAPASAMFAEYERQFGHSHTQRQSKESFNRFMFERFIRRYTNHDMRRVYTEIYPRVETELNDVLHISFERLTCKETRNEELRKMLYFLTDAPFSDQHLEDIFLHAEKFHRPKGDAEHVDFNFAYTDEFLVQVNEIFGMPTDREEYFKAIGCGGSYNVNFV